MSSGSTSTSTLPAQFRTASRVITVPIWARNAEPDLIQSAEVISDGSESIIEIPRNVTIASSSKIAEKDRWWSFTLPHRHAQHELLLSFDEKGKSKEKVIGQSESDYFGTAVHDSDGEERASLSSRKHSRLGTLPGFTNLNDRFSTNQVQTPGWSSPWRPFERPNHQRDAFEVMKENTVESKKSKFRKFLLNSAFTPLIFRGFNVAFNVVILIVAVKILLQERALNVVGVMGASNIFCIVISPFAIVHIMVVLYLEYFGLPIGLWKMHIKMQHVLYELIFICLWSATLSLCLTDLFSSPLDCSTYTPYSRYNVPLSRLSLESALKPSIVNQLCSKQGALVGLVFISVGLYIIVLVVSLFRIFDKVGKSRA